AEEGLAYQGYIDIFDGGITLEAPPSQVRSIHDSQRLVLAIGTPGDEAQTYLVLNRERQHCRITAASGMTAAGTLVVTAASAERHRLRSCTHAIAVDLDVEAGQ